MKNKFFLLGFVALSLLSCKTKKTLNITDIVTEKNIKITSEIEPDKEISEMIVPYKKTLEMKMNSKISRTDIELTKIGDNSNLGNLLADYTLEGAKEWGNKNQYPKIDLAVINIGGIRTSIGKGDILLKHIYEVMPFENELVIVKMNGAQLQGLFNYYLETQKNNPVANMIIETENGKINKALINGIPINPNQIYHIATSDYLALGGDNMRFFSVGEMISTQIKLRDLYIEKFKQNPQVKIPTDLRLIFKTKNQK